MDGKNLSAERDAFEMERSKRQGGVELTKVSGGAKKHKGRPARWGGLALDSRMVMPLLEQEGRKQGSSQ